MFKYIDKVSRNKHFKSLFRNTIKNNTSKLRLNKNLLNSYNEIIFDNTTQIHNVGKESTNVLKNNIKINHINLLKENIDKFGGGKKNSVIHSSISKQLLVNLYKIENKVTDIKSKENKKCILHHKSLEVFNKRDIDLKKSSVKIVNGYEIHKEHWKTRHDKLMAEHTKLFTEYQKLTEEYEESQQLKNKQQKRIEELERRLNKAETLPMIIIKRKDALYNFV